MADKLTMFERRLEMLFYILYKKQADVPTLASFFSVSKCTAYRDIVYLSRYAPIYTQNGKYGGVFLSTEHQNDLKLHLSVEEENLLKELVDVVNDDDSRLLKNILHKYAMPQI